MKIYKIHFKKRSAIHYTRKTTLVTLKDGLESILAFNMRRIREAENRNSISIHNPNKRELRKRTQSDFCLLSETHCLLAHFLLTAVFF